MDGKVGDPHDRPSNTHKAMLKSSLVSDLVHVDGCTKKNDTLRVD